jgi:hypothetical protein
VLFKLIKTANVLNMTYLLDTTYMRIANRLKTMTTQEIKDEFGLIKDFAFGEEEKIMRDLEEEILIVTSQKSTH